MVAGAVRRGDGMRVRVRASAVDGTRCGQVLAGPDSGAPRAQERPGGGGRGRAHAAGRRGTAGARCREARSGLGGRAGNKRERKGRGPGQPEWSGGEAVRPGGAREQRGRRGRARGVGEKKRKWEKEKKKRKRKKEGREIKREREGEGRARRRRSRPRSATRGARARVSATRGSRGNRVLDTGVGSLGNRKIWRNREVPGKTGVRVSRRDLELNDEAKF